MSVKRGCKDGGNGIGNKFNLRDAMQLSGHRDTKTALRYYRPGELAHNPATKLFVDLRPILLKNPKTN